jgi:hypothetical protein
MTQLFFGLMEVQDAPLCLLSHKKMDHSLLITLLVLAQKTHIHGLKTSPWFILSTQSELDFLKLQMV